MTNTTLERQAPLLSTMTPFEQELARTLGEDPVEELRTFLHNQLALHHVHSDQVRQIYQQCITLHQSSVSKRGRALEDAVAQLFVSCDIPYLRQACVNRDGKIIRAKKGHHRHDFVIQARVGDMLHNKIVVSCKTSLRERFLQDANVPCHKLFMVTMDSSSLGKLEALQTEHRIHLILVPSKNMTSSMIPTEHTVDYMLRFIQTYLGQSV